MADQVVPEGQATLVVSRSSGAYRDALRSYVVDVDGKQVGTVGTGEKVAVTVAPGHHVVQARIDWTGSPEVEFTVTAGEHATFSVDAAGSAFRLDQLFSKSRYLTLERVD